MRRVDLLKGQMGEGPGHSLAEVGWESGIAKGLDEEDGGGDALVEEGEFVFVVDFSGAVPVYCSVLVFSKMSCCEGETYMDR